MAAANSLFEPKASSNFAPGGELESKVAQPEASECGKTTEYETRSLGAISFDYPLLLC